MSPGVDHVQSYATNRYASGEGGYVNTLMAAATCRTASS